jgi:UDP-N-acetylglucosamine 1-carboxyvinyltransferase
MAAARARGTTVIMNAACEAALQDLCHLLCKMGVGIQGIGSDVLVIRAPTAARHPPGRADHIEVASFIGLAAVRRRPPDRGRGRRHLVPIRQAFTRLGVEIQVDGTTVRVPPNQTLEIVDDIHDQIPKIDDGPWPMFPADLTSIALAVATQARGTVLIFEKMFENRLVFTDKLVSMGARIILCDPHRAVITGPAKLYGYRMESGHPRRHGDADGQPLRGSNRIGNVGQIDRGYERITRRLRDLGARIERVEA